MLIPTPPLDDIRFQQIVDEAKRLIPKYCPEWTDHNVSDPGVALIELFAWMTEMLIYRVNQVPDRMYMRFLELIGMELETTRAAQAPVTFYLSAAQDTDFEIKVGTEVATVRTETNPAIIFTTEEQRVIKPPVIRGVYTYNASHSGAESWTAHDLRQLNSSGEKIAIFPPKPATGDSFCIALRDDHSFHVMALVVDCITARAAGVDPTNPPLRWEVSQKGHPSWARCDVEFDSTYAFNQEGEKIIILRLPKMEKRELYSLPGVEAYWLRCTLTEEQGNLQLYKNSPEVRRLSLESRGATVSVRHAVAVRDEVIGHSNGTPGQTFQLVHSPVLELDEKTEYLEVENSDGIMERWTCRRDFADSGPKDKHYTLDCLSGTITLGPTLIQPHGKVYKFGAIPPKDRLLRFSCYRYGGGRDGNVSRNTITVLKENQPYISQITNWRAAEGGRNAQSLADAKLRAPQYLRTRTRAVTRDDYEYLAMQVAGVARSCCVTPGAQPSTGSDPRPGEVFVYVLPQTEVTERPIEPAHLLLSADLRRDVQEKLDTCRLLGTTLDVRPPEYIRVAVAAKLRVSEHADAAVVADVQKQALESLYAYLDPYIGGPEKTGWPFGRDLHSSEIFGLLQGISGVEFVEGIRFNVAKPIPGVESGKARLVLPRNALICSDTHNITVLRVT